MVKLLLNVATKKLVEAYINNPSHALCLIGEEGTGLGSLADSIAKKLSGKAQIVTTISPEKGFISIERIRHLYEQTRNIQQGNRCIIIDDADTMSNDAQNSLLKLLEEPVRNVYFILTTHHPSFLLPTINSRMQHITVNSIDEKASKELLSKYALSEKEHMQALFLAAGKPAELTRIATDTEYFAVQTSLITDARSLIQSNLYDRLTVIKKYSDRRQALSFLAMCAKLLQFSLVRQRNITAAEHMELFDRVMKRIDANGHVRTHLMYLVTKLP